MSIRAKFQVRRIERQTTMIHDGVDQFGRDKYKSGEQQTIVMSPVYANGDPNHENSKFWAATPSGEIKMGVIHLESAQYFELDKQYYVDFTLAEPDVSSK